jgi:hypothetical protein
MVAVNGGIHEPIITQGEAGVQGERLTIAVSRDCPVSVFDVRTRLCVDTSIADNIREQSMQLSQLF